MYARTRSFNFRRRIASFYHHQKNRRNRKAYKVTFAVLRRIAWKTFCKTDNLYKMWSKKIPEVFNQGYFSAAVLSTFGDFGSAYHLSQAESLHWS